MAIIPPAVDAARLRGGLVSKNLFASGIVVAACLAGCGGGIDSEERAVRPGATLADLDSRLAVLEHRKSLIEDAKDIKRLQRAYGYYLDEGLWDEVADLFAADGTIEIGLDGIYVGKERVREYLYALGGGKAGLAEGELNEHLQLMPVVTVAPDGITAKGRWRALIMAGRLGESAIWGEGPYENEYVKENGVWKLKKVHWYQSVVVPYETGWLNTEDVNQGKWASQSLAPDRPPTIEYSTWPETYLPEFHFPNPVLGVPRRIEIATSTGRAARSLEDIAASAAALAQEAQRLEDENTIENLQRIYGFYIDKGFWSEAADLFAAEATIEVGGSGVFVGKDRVLQYLRSQGAEFPQEGRLNDQMQLQPIIHVAPDGRTAKARWHSFSQEAIHGEYARWGTGVYENEYVKEDGVWKFASVHLYTTMITPYEDGWGKTALPKPGAIADLPPDRPPSVAYEAYPAAFVAPFHYENPVSGAPAYAGSPADHAAALASSVAAVEAELAALERRIVRLEDTEAVERLDTIRAYYLAHSQWDNSAGIFAPDGSIEIALRGVYVGRPAVRRNLNLYTEVGMQYGLLHNHMVFQPVIHIADDGLTAKMRSRAFSIMGQLGRYAQWMGGTYENEYVKQDGIWMIKRDHQINTYFAPYAIGWKDLAPRPPPGITESNPPDLPPTVPFEMYPRAFLPPYHYANPVTGAVVTWP
jgi:hypothetical protein